MPDASDIELLRNYDRQGSEEAFATLVQRHVNLVYSVALRHVAIAAHAEEITQAVFIILAHQGGGLRANTILEGWLHETTRLTSLRFLRGERRRQFREQEAYMQSTLQESAEAPAWHQLAPLLDQALAGLRKKDRDAVMLRFFKDKSLREVAVALNVNEAAAQRRVLRAVEKLRSFFTKRGVIIPAAVLTAAISSNSVQAAPVALAKTVTAIAVAKGATAGGSTLTLIKGAMKIMAWTKTKTAVVAGVLAVALSIGVGYSGFFLKTHPNQPGKLKLPAGETTPSVGFGDTHGIILASDGSLWAWGENDLGWPALGLGNIKKTPFLNRIGNENDWMSIAVGDSHNLALKKGGAIWGWGGDLYDELGNHTNFLRLAGTPNNSSKPVKSVLGNDWKQIAAGTEDSFGIKNDGTLWAWGLNDFGQLGTGGFKDNPAPSQVGSATWTKVYAGFINAAGIQSDGSLWVWGGGPDVGNTAARGAKNYSAPVRLSPDASAAEVAVGMNVVFVVKPEGTLWAWGYQASLFTGAPGDNAALAQIGTDTDWRSCSCCGSRYLMLMKKDGSLWRMNSSQGKPAQTQRINLRKDIVAMGGGHGLAVAVARDGEVWTWGAVIGEHLELHPTYTVLDKPWQLSNLDPKDQPAKN